MTRISRFKLSKRVYDKLSILLFEVVGKKGSREDFNKVLVDLLSPVERIMIAKRVVIIFLLMKEIDYRTICEVIKVSNGTVSKFKLIMEKSDGIVPALERLVKNEKILIFLEGLYNELFQRPGTYGVNWKNAWQRKFDYERRKGEGI